MKAGPHRGRLDDTNGAHFDLGAMHPTPFKLNAFALAVVAEACDFPRNSRYRAGVLAMEISLLRTVVIGLLRFMVIQIGGPPT